MKQCVNCGAWAQPNDLFCLHCGTMLNEAPSPIARAKKMCASPLYLIAAILFTAYVVLSLGSVIVGWLVNPMGVVMMLNSLLESAGLGVGVYPEQMEFATILFGLLQILGYIPHILTLAGLWMFYSACRKRPADVPAKTGGIGMMKVTPILNIISLFIGLTLMAIVMFLAFIVAIGTGDTAILITAIAMLVACAVFVLMLIYYFGVLRTLSTVKSAVTTGKRTAKVSMYVIIWNFILVLYNLATVVASFAMFSFGSAIAMLMYTGAVTLLTVALVQYRSKLEKTLEPKYPTPQDYPQYTQPQYGQPVYTQYSQPNYAPYGNQPPQAPNAPYNQQNVYGQYNAQPEYTRYEAPAQPEYTEEQRGPENWNR